MTRMPVNAIRVGSRVRKDPGDIDALAASIADIGLINPITVSPTDGSLIAGWRRLEAVKRLGWTDVEVRVAVDVADALDALKVERDENTCRKEFAPSEAVALFRVIAEAERPKATERRREGNSVGGRGGREVAAHGPATSGRVRDIAADAIGMASATLGRAKAVVDAAEDETLPPEVREVAKEAKEEMDASGQVLPAYRKVQDAKVNTITLNKTTVAVAERWAKIGELAGKGYTSRQIAETVGLSEQTVRQTARDRGIAIPADAVTGGTRRVDANRVVSETVAQVESAAFAIGVVPIDFDALDRDQLDHWVSSLTESLRSLTTLKNRLKELTHVSA